MMMPRRLLALAAAVLTVSVALLSEQAEAACRGKGCARNVVWAPGAQRTPFGGIAPGATLTPFGVTAPGVRRTSYGVARGRSTSFGIVAPGARTTSYGVLAGQKTSFGAMGSSCRKTSFGVACSDVRLKRDIVELARLDNGLGLYRFRYLWSEQLYVGVMAQDVLAIQPDAVVAGADGFLRVDYRKLGLRLQTWQEFSRRQRRQLASRT